MQKPEKLILTPKEAAEITGIGENKIRELCHTSHFPAFRVGNRFRIDREGLKKWIASSATAKVQL